MSEHGAQASARAIFYALGANLGIALAKTAAAIITNSGSMLAEAIHSFADCANQGLLFLGMHRAKAAPNDEHPLGYGKAIFFWSFIVALMLFSMGGLFSIYEGTHKLLQALAGGGAGLEKPWAAIIVLVIAIVLESLSLMGALRESRPFRQGKSLWRWFRASRQSELIVVVGEDTAALAGLALALVAILLSILTGNPLYDALGSIAIGVLLILVAVAVGVEVKSLLIGESADPAVEAKIRATLVAHPGVAEVLHLITLQLGTDVMVAVKARMAETGSVDKLITEINDCERGLRSAVPQVRWIFFEPDVAD
jgi:cation diffusion facilitator family transporter